MNKSETSKWMGYYKVVSNTKPRELLVLALDIVEKDIDYKNSYYAVDLGCGNGPDTIELLKRGWRVLAIDSQSEAIRIVDESVPISMKSRLELSCQRFEELSLFKVDLINASYSLPFCSPKSFDDLWIQIKNSLNSGGRFSGNLFGKNDTWAGDRNMTFHSREAIMKMFEDFELEHFEEIEEDGKTATGELKHWHVFDVIARKK